ncbi:septum formation initiator family protein [Elusimicrobiota bacterium]
MKGTGYKLFYIVIVIVLAAIYFSGSNIKNILRLKEKVTSYEERLAMLKKNNTDLLEELKWIKTEEDYLKFLARKKLGLVEPGEFKYYIIDKNPQQEE